MWNGRLAAGEDCGLLLQVILLFGLGNLNLLVYEAQQVSLFLGQPDFAVARHVHVDIDIDQVQITALHSRLHRAHERLDPWHSRRQHMALDWPALRVHDRICVLAD